MSSSSSVATSVQSSTPMDPAWRESRGEPAVRFFDNPLTRAFAQRALRPTNVWPGALVVAILGSLMTWGCTEAAMPDRMIIYRFALGLFALPLVLAAPLVIASSVGHDRASGLLDFHRSSPTTALTNVVGYIVGNAARWVVASAVGLPFAIVISLLAGNPITSTLASIGMIVAYAVCYASIAAMSGALVNTTKLLRAGLGAAVPLALLFVSAVGVSAGESRDQIHPLFMGALSPLIAVLPGISNATQLDAMVIVTAFTAFALRIAVRRFANDAAVPFSRMDASAFVVVMMGLHAMHERLVPEPTWQLTGHDSMMLSFSGSLSVALVAVAAGAVSLTPRRSHLVAWARREGGDPLAPVASAIASQGASIVPLVFVFGLVAAAMCIALIGSVDQLRYVIGPMIHSIGGVVLLPVLYAAAAENSSLRHPRNVAGWTMLSLVTVLLVPLGAAVLAAAVDMHDHSSYVIASLSPLYLPFAGLDGRNVPALSWASSLLAIAFFSARSMSARRALIARLSVSVKPVPAA